MLIPRITLGGVQYLGTRLPFDLLKSVGDSFFVPFLRRDPPSVKEAVRQRNKKGRGKFSYETSYEEAEGSVTLTGVTVTREPDKSIT